MIGALVRRAGKFRESIFLKIILVFGIAGAVEVTLLRVFQRDVLSNDLRREHRYDNMAVYGQYLAERLQAPIKHDELVRFADNLHLQIRIEGPGFQDVSSPEVPAFAVVAKTLGRKFADHFRSRSAQVRDFQAGGVKHGVGEPQTEVPRVGRFGDFLAVDLYDQKHVRYLFLLESENAIDAHPELLVFLVACLLTVLSGCYVAIRAILSPLNEIERAVKQVALGNLETEVAVRTKDELGRLGRSFNAMIQRVRSMINSKEQLLLDVSHEFRSPLTRIRVAMELQGDNGRASILRALGDLDTMLSELLESARLIDAQGRLKLERVNLADLVRETTKLYQDQKPGLKVMIEEAPVFSLVDPRRITIALRNLLENALKYSASQEKPVEVKLDVKQGTGDSSRVRISISDHGVGIPQEELDFIFEPFYRVDRSRVKSTGGYGLGLSLVQKIIIAHRGQIAVQSEQGKGSIFVVELHRDP